MSENRGQFFGPVALVVAAIGLGAILVGCGPSNVSKSVAGPTGARRAEDVSMGHVKRDGVLHAGYGGFEPYTKINVNGKGEGDRVTGYSVDLVNEIAKRFEPPLKVEWQLIKFETMKSELQSGKCDFIIDPIYATITRAADFGLTEPFTYVGVGCAVVRKDETRFKAFKDLDRDDITISVAVAWTSTEYAKKNLTKPKWKEVAVGGTPFEQLDDVLNGRADVALQDTPSVAQYVAAHPDKVKALWLDDPPSLLAAGFLTRRGDTEFTEFLSRCLRALMVDGTLRRLDEKWKTYGYFEKVSLVPGRGLPVGP